MTGLDTRRSSSQLSFLTPPLTTPPPPLPPPPRYSHGRSALRTPPFDDVECVNMYKPGGFHPVNLGDVLGQRYKVIHKLGHGGFAIVWLARDVERHQYVALKVLRADAPDREVRVLKNIQSTIRNTIPIAGLHEEFAIHGPNGIHQCLVTEVGGPSLRYFSLYCERPDLRFLQNASRKLAEGLAALHTAGICHGDLTDTNVLFEISGFHRWSQSQIDLCFGTPETAPLRLLSGLPAPPFAPAHVVKPLDFSRLSIDQLSGDVLIIDFGEAFLEDKPPQGLGTPASFRGPELIFGYQPSNAADLWALGCLIFEMHTWRTLLPTGFGLAAEALGIATETIGALPKEWVDRPPDDGHLLKASLGPDSWWFDQSMERPRTLDSQILKSMPDLSKEQQALFVELLESIMVFEPTSRLSAEAIARHPWFTQT